MSPRSTAVVAVAATLAVVGLLACGVVKPPERFPHERHLVVEQCGDEGQLPCPECLSCHSGISKPVQEALPTVKQCSMCHDDGADKFATEQTRSVRIRVAGGITFPHGKHLQMDKFGGQCVACHGGIIEDGKKGTVYPDMDLCLECHNEQFEQGSCTPCHKFANLATLVPQTFLRHDLDFLKRHGEEAVKHARVCNQCHAQTVCADCHDTGQPLEIATRRPDAIERGVIHRGDFLTRHPIEARLQPSRCMTCHTTSSCEGCHVERGVSAARIGAANPHPPGWLGRDTGSPQFHGRAARRDIVSCAACHDQGPATNCIRCHTSGGPGGNPHGGVPRSSQSRTEGMCAYCHTGP